MKKVLQEYLHFTRSERRAVLLLSTIIILLFLSPYFCSIFIEEETYDYSEFEDEIAIWEAGLLNQDSIRKSKYWKNKAWAKKSKQPKKKVKIHPFPFNPNEASEKQFLDLGLPNNVVQIILNYRTKGGKFYAKEDLKKIYGLKDEWYQELAPFVRIKKDKYANSKNRKYDKKSSQPIAAHIPKSYGGERAVFVDKEKDKPITPSKQKWKPIIIPVNGSSASDLQKVYGIGPTYAKRIVSYREILGGFVALHQILEVYGIEDTTFQKIKPSLQLGEVDVQKININTATVDELKKHPYLKWRTAKAIIKYRDTHGFYSSVEDLKKNYAVSKDLYIKLEPYLTIE